jgi:phage tail-like protein
MAVVGTPRVFQKKFAFQVEIDGIRSAAFTRCSELSAEIGKVEQREGGKLIPDKSPGLVNITDVTLERGVANGDSDLYNWWLDVVKVSAGGGTGKVTPFYKRQVEILQLDRDASVLKRWVLEGAWPTKCVVGEWDNDADENVVESLVLTFDTFDLV